MPQTCPQCQNQAPDEANHCPNCGARLAGAPATAQGASTRPPPQMGGQSAGAATPAASGSSVPAYKFNAARWTLADRIAGIATIVLFISLFLNWFNASIAGVTGGSESGLSAHGYLYIVLILCILIVAYLALKAGWDQLPIDMKIPHLTLMMALTVANLVLVLIGFVFKPSVPLSHVSVGWSFGAVLGLLAALAAAAPYVVPQLRAKTM